MKNFIPILFALSLIGCHSSIKIVNNQETSYRIVLPEAPSAAEKFAAQELQGTILKMTGAKMEMVEGIHTDTHPAIFLGSPEELADQLNSEAPTLKEEHYYLKNQGDDIFIISNEARGLMYGVYALLKDEWGCRWYTNEVSVIPEQKNLSLPKLETVGGPAFESREVYFTEAADPLWCVRNRLNRSMKNIPDSLGGGYGIYPFVHTFYRLVPPHKYFSTHPEYFSLIAGKRKGHDAQLCLTNPNVLKIATQQVFQWIKENPDARIITVDQNDGGGWCQCEKCKKINDAQGSQSGTILTFVNAIADSVAKKYPNVSVQTLAYYYSEKPPKTIRPHDNVIIRLCRYADYCDAHAIEGCSVNKPFIKQLQSWNKIAPRIMVWDYLVDFRHFFMPFPNFDGIKKDIKFYHDNGVTGLFEQGSYPIQGAELSQLRAWVLAQLLWNPDQNADDLIDEFLENVYGAAAPHLKAYIDLIHTNVHTDSVHFNMYAEPTAGHLTPDIVAKAEKIFEKAEAGVADSPDILKRVEAAHLPMLYSRLYFYTIGGKAAYLSDEEMPPVRDKFLRVAKENGVKQLAENRKRGIFEDFIEKVNQSKGMFLTDWHVVGPFENINETGLTTNFPPERSFDSTAVYDGVNGKVKWERHSDPSTGYVDFTKIFETSEIGVAYAYTTITVSSDADLKIGIGSNDGVRAWVNDALVIDKAVKRTAKPNQEVITVPVKQGENSILLKIDQFGGGWGFYFTILEGTEFIAE